MKDSAALRDQVYQNLRSAILEGRLKVNERLKQDELAKKMNVSRMPVREAFRYLEREGLITVIPHRGAWVSQLKVEKLVEVYMLRKMLEEEAVKLAVPRFYPEKLAKLILLNQKFARAVKNNDYRAIIKINKGFHFALYSQSGFPFLTKIIRDLWNHFPHYTFNLFPGKPPKSVQHHWDIIDAVSRGEAEEAGKLMYKHIDDSKKTLLAELT